MLVTTLLIKGAIHVSLQVRAPMEEPFYSPSMTVYVVESDYPCVILGRDFIDARLSSNEAPGYFQPPVPDEQEKIDAYLEAELFLSLKSPAPRLAL